MMKTVSIILIAVFMSFSTVYGQSTKDNSKKAGPPRGMSQKKAYYLYYIRYANGNYKGAMKYGRWILESKPRTIKNYSNYDLSTNLDRFITIYTTYADKATDLSVKSAYIDTVNQIYRSTFKDLGKDEFNAYQWHLNWGRFYHQYSDFIDSAKAKATQQYYEAYKLKPDSIAQGSAYYLKVLIQNLKDKGTDQANKKARSIIKNERQYASNSLSDYLDNAQKGLFKNTAQRVAYLKKKVKKNPKDEETLKTLRTIYQRQGKAGKVLQVSKKLYKLNPNYANATLLANAAIKNSNYQKAITYLKKAKGETDDKSKLKIIDLNLARSYKNLGSLQEARRYARKASQMDPNWGRPYILIADIYANTVKNCTSGRELTKGDKAVYWVVLDYLNKAKRVDPSVASTANSQLSVYRQYTPTKQDIFFKSGWKKGQTITIGSSIDPCYSWINETTTIRD